MFVCVCISCEHINSLRGPSSSSLRSRSQILNVFPPFERVRNRFKVDVVARHPVLSSVLEPSNPRRDYRLVILDDPNFHVEYEEGGTKDILHVLT